MSYYSDPTANMAIGNVNREFSKLEKQAKRIRKDFEEGRISEKQLKMEQRKFRGIYRNILKNVLNEEKEDSA